MGRKKILKPEQKLVLAAIDTVKDVYMEINSTINIDFIYELSKLRTDVVAKRK